MERSQFACLATQAAARGILDFSEADVYDPAWARKQRLVFDALAKENELELVGALHRHSLAVLAAPWLSEDASKKQMDTAAEVLDDLLAIYCPWQFSKKSKEEREKEEATQYRNSWQRTFGSLDDPNTQGKLQRLRAALLEKGNRDRVPDSPLGRQGVFNSKTANQIGSLKSAHDRT